MSVYFYTPVLSMCLGFSIRPPVFSSSLFFLFLGVQIWRFTLFGERVPHFWVQALCDIYHKVYDKGMKSSGAEGAYLL